MYRAYPAPPQSASTVKDSTAATGSSTRNSVPPTKNTRAQLWPAAAGAAANKSTGIRPLSASPQRPPYGLNSAIPGNVVRLTSPSRGGRNLPPSAVGGLVPPAASVPSATAVPTVPPMATARPRAPPLGSPPKSRPFSFDKSATIMEDKIEARKKKLEALKAKSLHSSTILARAKAVTAPPTGSGSSGAAKSFLEGRMVGPPPSANPPPAAPTSSTVPQGVGGSTAIGISNSPPRHNVAQPAVNFEMPPRDDHEMISTSSSSPTMIPFHDVTNEERKVKEEDILVRSEDGGKTQQHGKDHPVLPTVGPPPLPAPPVPVNEAATENKNEIKIDANLDKELPALNTNKRLTLEALRQVATSPKRNDSLSPAKKNVSPIKDVQDTTSASTVENAILPDTITNAAVADEDGMKENVEHATHVQDGIPNSANQVSSPAKISSVSVSPTPPTSPTETSTLRLVRELRMAKQEKEQAMKRMAELEGQVMELRFELNSNVTKSQPLERRTGRTLERDDGSVMEGRRNRTRRMMKSPEPRRDRTEDPLQNLNVASRAVETVEEIFESPLARFVVRKPYGGNEIQEYRFAKDATDEKSVLDFPVEWVESVNNYLKNATVKDEKTLEVMAKVGADSSILIVYGDSCRHGIPQVGNDGSLVGYEFKTFDNVDDMEGTLGKVIYIDSEGNDGEYWLDTIYEEALKIRESYCSNVFSAALALKATEPASKEISIEQQQQQKQQEQLYQPPQFPNRTMPEASPQVISKPTMVDECVDTEDLHPVVSPSTKTSTSSPSTDKPPPSQSQKHEVRYDSHSQQSYGSTAILCHFVVSVFSVIYSIMWFVLMIPVRVTQITFTICVMIGIVNVLWFYLADNKVAIDMGAMIDKQYNIN